MSEQIAEQMTDNEALRRILAHVETISGSLRGSLYGSVTGADATVSSGNDYLAAADARSVKALVVNRGSVSVDIHEDGVQVAVLPAGQTWVSPLSGKKAIKVSSSLSCLISFARYLAAE